MRICTHTHTPTHPRMHAHTHTHTHTQTHMLFLIESFSYSFTHLVSSNMWCMNSSSLTPVSAVTNSVFDWGVTCASLGLRPQFHRCPPPAGPQWWLWWAAGQAEGGCGGCHCLAWVSVCIVFLMIATCMLILFIAEWFMHVYIWRCEHAMFLCESSCAPCFLG